MVAAKELRAWELHQDVILIKTAAAAGEEPPWIVIIFLVFSAAAGVFFHKPVGMETFSVPFRSSV